MDGGRNGAPPQDGEEPPTYDCKDEPSYTEGREQKPIPAPAAFRETISVRVCPKHLYINVRQSDSRVTRIYKDSKLLNVLCIGDKILQVDDHPLDTRRLLNVNAPLKDSGCNTECTEKGSTPEYCKEHQTVQVTMKFLVERAVYSWSRMEMTTLEQEQYTTQKKISFSGRPIKRYTVILRRPRLPGLEVTPLGIKLRYDERDRVTVASTVAGSVASAHLRPRDIIKRVNGDAVTTKTMCAFMIAKSLRQSGQVYLSIDALDNATPPIEMPEDVIAICAKQIELMKSGTVKPLPPIIIVRPPVAAAKVTAAGPPSLRKAAPAVRKDGEKKITYAAGPATVVEIMSSVEEGTTLKSSKLIGGDAK